jgi:hypothetical protein
MPHLESKIQLTTYNRSHNAHVVIVQAKIWTLNTFQLAFANLTIPFSYASLIDKT